MPQTDSAVMAREMMTGGVAIEGSSIAGPVGCNGTALLQINGQRERERERERKRERVRE